MVLAGLYKSKIQDSVQLQENIRNNGQPSYSRLRRHIDQVTEDKKFQSPERNSGKRDSDQESQREESQRGEESGRMPLVESNGTVF